MMAGILSIHTPLVRDYPSAPPTPPAPPAPPARPLPPAADAIAFSVVALPSLSTTKTVAVSSTTLATVTCADAAMTVSLSEPVPGLTFSYAAKVLSVAGTPTTAGLHRVIVSYVASDGSNTIRGSSTHLITVADASNVLTIGDMAAVSGRVGLPLNVTLCSLSTNYPVEVVATPSSLVHGCAVGLAWVQTTTSGSGDAVLTGTPLFEGALTLTINYRTWQGVVGTSTHAVEIAAAYETPAPAPAPAPAPSPTAPPTPPASSPAPAPGQGADPLWPSVEVLMRFDSATGIATDLCGNTFTNNGATPATGAVNDAASFSSALTNISGTADLDAPDTGLFAECMVDIDATAWASLTASGANPRYCPAVTYIGTDGGTLWSLGFLSYMLGSNRVVQAVFMNVVNRTTYGPWFVYATANSSGTIASRPNRFVHIGGGRAYQNAMRSKFGAWFDGVAGSGVETTDGTLKVSDNGTLRIGGACPAVGMQINYRTPDIVPFSGKIDELRVTVGTRNSAYFGVPNVDLPTAARVIPWPNH